MAGKQGMTSVAWQCPACRIRVRYGDRCAECGVSYSGASIVRRGHDASVLNQDPIRLRAAALSALGGDEEGRRR